MPSEHKKILWGAVILYVIVMTAASFWKYELFRYNAIDLAYYNQVFWKTIHGQPFGLTIHPHLSLGDHVEPFLLLLAPFYWLWPDARMLLLLQSLALTLTALPIYSIASFLVKRHRVDVAQSNQSGVISLSGVDDQSGHGSAVSAESDGRKAVSHRAGVANEAKRDVSDWLPLITSLLWLANPLVHNVNLLEFHILPFALPFLFLAILAYEKEQIGRFILWSLIALTVREDLSLAIGAFALLAIIDVLRKKRSWQWIAVPLFLSASWFILAQKIAAVYAVGGSYKFLVYYAWLGDSFPHLIANIFLRPLTVLAHIATGNTLLFILALGTPFLFLFFVRPRYLIVTLPILAQHLLATYGGDPLIAETHYVTLLLPGLVLATMVTLIHPPRVAGIAWFTPQSLAQDERARPPTAVGGASPSGSAISSQGKLITSLRSESAVTASPLFSILLIVATFYSATTTLGPLYGIAIEHVSTAERQERTYFLSQIPATASVATTESFLTSLSRRNAVYLLRYVFAGETQYGKAPYYLPQSTEYILIDTNDLVAYKTGSVATLRTAFASFGVIAANGPFVLLKQGAGIPLLATPAMPLSSAKATITHEQPCSVPPLTACAHFVITANNTDGAVALLRTPNNDPLFLPLAYGMGAGIVTQSHYWLPQNKNISITIGDVAHTLVLTNDRAVDYRHTIINEQALSVNEVRSSQ